MRCFTNVRGTFLAEVIKQVEEHIIVQEVVGVEVVANHPETTETTWEVEFESIEPEA